MIASALLALLYGGRVDCAASWSARLIGESSDRGLIALKALLIGVDAEIALWQGEPVEALTRVRAALTALAPHGWGVQIGYPLATALTAAAALGCPETGARILARRVPAAM